MGDKSKKISTIIAAHNCEKYIEKSLDSIFSQSLGREHYEVIVINDGSTDGTLDVLKKYEDKIRLIDQKHKGMVVATNTAISKGKGKYIMRLDPDDYYDADLLLSTLNVLESKPSYHCVYTDRYEIDEKTNTKKLVHVGENNVFDMIACGILFRREVFEKIGMYDELLFEEYDFMMRFFDHGPKGFYLQKPLYFYVKHPSSMTEQKNYWKKGWEQLVKKWGERELNKWVNVQVREKGSSRFLNFRGV